MILVSVGDRLSAIVCPLPECGLPYAIVLLSRK